MLSVANKPILVSVVMLNVVMPFKIMGVKSDSNADNEINSIVIVVLNGQKVIFLKQSLSFLINSQSFE